MDLTFLYWSYHTNIVSSLLKYFNQPFLKKYPEFVETSFCNEFLSSLHRLVGRMKKKGAEKIIP